jgi:hypothetical protein
MSLYPSNVFQEFRFELRPPPQEQEERKRGREERLGRLQIGENDLQH